MGAPRVPAGRGGAPRHGRCRRPERPGTTRAETSGAHSAGFESGEDEDQRAGGSATRRPSPVPDGQGVPHALAGAGLDELGVAASAAAAERGDSLGDLVRSRLPHAQATLATQRAGVQLSLEAPFWGRGTGPVSMLYRAGDAEGYRVVPLLRSPNAQPRTPPRPCGFSTSRRPRNLRRVPQVSDAHEDGATEAAAQLASGAPRPPDPGAGDGASAAHDGPPADKAPEPTPGKVRRSTTAAARRGSAKVWPHSEKGALEATATDARSSRSVRIWKSS